MVDYTTLSFGNYTTTEQDTGFTWIDGKKIYKKTIKFNWANAVTNIAHGISNLGSRIKMEGMVNHASYGWRPLNFITADSGLQYSSGMGNWTDTAVTFLSGEGGTRSGNGWVTLYYTKSS